MIKTRKYVVGKDLTRGAALAAVRRKDKKDYRGFTYDPKTGKATIT